MSSPPSLFFIEDGEAGVIDLSKVVYARPEEQQFPQDEVVESLVVYFVGGPVMHLYTRKVKHDFLVALATYHELFVSPARSGS